MEDKQVPYSHTASKWSWNLNSKAYAFNNNTALPLKNLELML